MFGKKDKYVKLTRKEYFVRWSDKEAERIKMGNDLSIEHEFHVMVIKDKRDDFLTYKIVETMDNGEITLHNSSSSFDVLLEFTNWIKRRKQSLG